MTPPFDITPPQGDMRGYTRLPLGDGRKIVAHDTGPDAEAAVLGKWEEAMLLARIEIQEGRDG